MGKHDNQILVSEKIVAIKKADGWDGLFIQVTEKVYIETDENNNKGKEKEYTINYLLIDDDGVSKTKLSIVFTYLEFEIKSKQVRLRDTFISHIDIGGGIHPQMFQEMFSFAMESVKEATS